MWKLGKDGDLVFESRRIATVSGTEAFAQRVRLRLSTVRGSYWADTTYGVDYQRLAWSRRIQSTELLEADMRRVISETPGFRRFLEWSVSHDRVTRSFSVITKIECDTGVATIEEEIEL